MKRDDLQATSLRREALSTTPFGFLATADGFPLFALILLAAGVGLFSLWAKSYLPWTWALMGTLLVAPGLYAVAVLTSTFTHRQVRQWAAALPFAINYPAFLGIERIEAAQIAVVFRGDAPDAAPALAACEGLEKWWLPRCSIRDGALQIDFSMEGADSGGRYTAHRRMRSIVTQLIVPLHERHPVDSVHFDSLTG